MSGEMKTCPVCGGEDSYERHETCHNENEGHDSNEFECSVCHIRLADFAEIVEEDGQAYKFYYALRYCPNCGSMVVDDER